MNSSRRTLLIQILVIFLVLLTIGVLAYIFIPQTIRPNQHRITLRIESSSGTATIQYDAGENKQKDATKTFNTPWERSWILDSGTQVVLTAGNPQEMGTIKCFVRIDGQNWKSDMATIPDDKVACAGIVR
jgi:hypothetical protein